MNGKRFETENVMNGKQCYDGKHHEQKTLRTKHYYPKNVMNGKHYERKMF